MHKIQCMCLSCCWIALLWEGKCNLLCWHWWYYIQNGTKYTPLFHTLKSEYITHTSGMDLVIPHIYIFWNAIIELSQDTVKVTWHYEFFSNLIRNLSEKSLWGWGLELEAFNPLRTGDLKFYQSQGLSTFWGLFIFFN